MVAKAEPMQEDAAVDVHEDESGLEVEREDSDEITRPFNPERIRIRQAQLLIGQLVSRITHDEIDLAPDFQRKAGIWNAKNKSRLIESLLLKIPIPVFYVAADETDRWAVVDGVQRMSTINDYVTGRFPLEKLEYLTNMNGLKHDELPRGMQRRIDETQLVVNVIEPGTPSDVMFNVFLRINTGGLILRAQEIRHALEPGPVRDYLKELAESDEFLTATGGSVSPKRMADRECVLRFMAFHVDPWENYKTGDLDGYLGKAMKRINGMEESERAMFGADFKKAMLAATDIFGQDAFRKKLGFGDRRRPVNKALFETWSVHLARRSPEQIASLTARRAEVQRLSIRLMEQDDEFDRAISYTTGSVHRVRKRFEAVGRLLEGLV